ncbi:MazG family protein [Actinotalea solisilvae]|uniref:MazG family protein n=1 Tax=Actinotalea solisilvae TaxID=2072922 RepID=UPI0018F13D3B|nr:MazG family protein [Actinotalea solisilvae]
MSGTAAGPGAGEHPGVADLVAVMDRLRSPGGCPWDAEQTHRSLARYAVEEVHELVEAIETDDRAALREELGDVLLQVVFHARVAAEHPQDPFDVDDVAAGVAAKLRRRHPHVFGDAVVRDADHVSSRWDEIKRAEKGRTSALDGVPAGLPALARAQAVLSRAARAGGAAEAATADVPARPGDAATDVGQRLLALVAEAQAAGVDAEAALRAAARDLEDRVRAAERA